MITLILRWTHYSLQPDVQFTRMMDQQHLDLEYGRIDANEVYNPINV